jgi:hypothetical protein
MGDIIPWRKKKKQLDWIEGVTPRKKQPRRMPFTRDALAAGLAIAALAAIYLLFSDFSLLGWP